VTASSMARGSRGTPPRHSPPSPIDAFVEVLGDAEAGVTTDAFYGRLCDVICRLAEMDVAVLFRYDEMLRRVRVAGAHGIDLSIFDGAEVSVESTPIARRALAEDVVIEARAPFEHDLPSEYLPLVSGGTLVCVPLAAAGRWVGVVLCQRDGVLPLADSERHVLWTLGKTAALAAAARIATSAGERACELQQRIDLAREVHDGVIQRLFGVSLALDADGELRPDARKRAAAEIRSALAELRSAVERPLSRAPRPTHLTLADEVRRLARRHPDLSIAVDPDSSFDVPPHLESLAQSVLGEALRNAHKHARPTRVQVRTGIDDGAFIMEVANDGVARGSRQTTGMGLRIAAFEALREGGFVEFGPRDGEWQVRLVVPVDDAE
jgi:signal transduction histidine kinase